MRAHVSIRKSIGQLVSRSPLSFRYVREFGSPLVRAKKLITEHTHASDKYNRYSLKIKFVLVLPTRALRTDLHSAVLLGGEDGNKAGNKEHLKRLYIICH